MAQDRWKLNYKILGRRLLSVSGAASDAVMGGGLPDMNMEMVDVVWTHADGFPADTREIPVPFDTVNLVLDNILARAESEEILDSNQVKKIKALKRQVFKPQHSTRGSSIGLLCVEDGTRTELADQLNVREGTPDSIVMQMLEEKRPKLALSLGVEP